MLGTYALSSGYYEAYYGRAQRVRTKIADDFRAAFEKVDLVITPTSPTVAFRLGERTDDPLAMYLSDYCTVPMPLAGIPAISIPGGLADDLPVGIQLAGPAFSENRILDAAYALEQAIGFDGAPRVTDALAERHYEPVIGLEIHVQLRTRTKMFCGCALSFGEEPNTHTCPICLGHPGTLPVTNAEAVHFGLMIAHGARAARSRRGRSSTARTTSIPTCRRATRSPSTTSRSRSAGRLGDVRVHRVHLEEDAAKLVHAGSSGRIHGAEASVVDFNRGGTPLVEIVSEPDLRSAAEAAEWARLLRATLKRLGVSDVNMEEGSLRVDANVSIRPAGESTLGTKTELKNMNSFRFLERGIEAEIARQEAILRDGGEVVAGDAPLRPADRRRSARCARRRRRTTTATSRSPTSCRSRPPRRCSSARATRCPSCPPRAPSASSRARAARADTRKLLAFRSELGRLLRGGAGRRRRRDPRALANWVTGELLARLGDTEPADSKVEPAALAKLVAMVAEKTDRGLGRQGGARRAGRRGRRPARRSWRSGRSAWRASDELGAIVDRAIEQNADAVEKVRGRQRQGDRRDRGRGDARDEGPRRRRRGAAHDPRADRLTQGPYPAGVSSACRTARKGGVRCRDSSAWTPPATRRSPSGPPSDEAAFEAAVEAFRRELDEGYIGVVSDGPGHAHAGARAARARPTSSMMRRPIAGG